MTGVLEMIKLKNVHKTFGHLEVLKGIDLEVAKGEKLVIIGPSGSGKSTLIRCMNGLEEVTKGEVYIDGHLMTHKTRAALNRQYSSMVFQQFNLYPHLTVMENLTLAPIKLKKVPKGEAEELAMANLRRVGLEKKAFVYPTTLSGGQQQRIAIARSLTMKNPVIYFDEPTSALDPEMVQEVLDIMVELGHDNIRWSWSRTRWGLRGRLPTGWSFATADIFWNRARRSISSRTRRTNGQRHFYPRF